uniref:Uncharacterized protein n=1 Tax=Arundo donax TaxID=35708 RepID=A0A0A9F5I7_ARUDO
MNHRAPPTWV